MATRYWVGGSGTWDAASNSHWSSSAPATAGASGNAPQSVPGALDDVIFDANAGSGAYVVTVTDNFTINSLTTNVAVSLTMSFTTPTTPPGTWNIGYWQNFGAGARVFNFGAGTFNINGTNANLWGWNPTTNVTLNAGTSTLVFGNNTATARPITLGSTALAYNNIVVLGNTSLGTYTIANATGITVASLTINAPNWIEWASVSGNVPHAITNLSFAGGSSSNWIGMKSSTAVAWTIAPGSAVTGDWITTRQLTFTTSPVNLTNHINQGITTFSGGGTQTPPSYGSGGGGGGVIGVIGS